MEKNNRCHLKKVNGFVMMETIIVISILAIALISLYSTYVSIARKNNSSTINKPIDTYIAYQVDKYNYTDFNGSITNPYFVEIYNMGSVFLKRECGLDNAGNGVCGTNSTISSEASNIYKTIGIDKIYYFKCKLSELLNDNVLLLFDGSTINYLESIKNSSEIDDNSVHTVIVKMQNTGSGSTFSFYQELEHVDSTLLRKAILGDNNQNVKTPMTIPGKNISANNESILASAIDDYGVSYYYRGNVQNNYIVFANMCWRIVRVTGSGDIKIVLYNYNNSSCTEEGSDLAFARYDETNSGKAGISAFNNTSETSNAYIGYMYGTPNSTTYNNEHANLHDSTILTNLKKWYDKVFNDSQKAMIADTIWCNDKRIVSNSSFNPLNFSVSATGYGNGITYYQAMKRIHTVGTVEPTLTCGKNINDNRISKFTAYDNVYGNGALNGYKIGLLTADEVAYAGNVSVYISDEGSQYYLYKNSYGKNWLTMSPFYGPASIIHINSSSPGLISGSSITYEHGVRPSIALDKNILVTGTGTSSNPYIVVS